MNFELITKAVMVNNQPNDAIYISEFCTWIPIPSKGARIEIIISEGEMEIKYRCIKVNGHEYLFHQFRYEYGRPQLLKGVLELAQEISRLSTRWENN